MAIDKVRFARSQFFNHVCGMRGGDRIMRALAIELIDLEKIMAMSDGDLIMLPGIGSKNLRHVRAMLRLAIEEQSR
jgi:hypothetical protein